MPKNVRFRWFLCAIEWRALFFGIFLQIQAESPLPIPILRRKKWQSLYNSILGLRRFELWWYGAVLGTGMQGFEGLFGAQDVSIGWFFRDGILQYPHTTV